jgi:hypothetical protein
VGGVTYSQFAKVKIPRHSLAVVRAAVMAGQGKTAVLVNDDLAAGSVSYNIEPKSQSHDHWQTESGLPGGGEFGRFEVLGFGPEVDRVAPEMENDQA